MTVGSLPAVITFYTADETDPFQTCTFPCHCSAQLSVAHFKTQEQNPSTWPSIISNIPSSGTQWAKTRLLPDGEKQNKTQPWDNQ